MKPEIATHRDCPRCHQRRPWHWVHPDHGCLTCAGTRTTSGRKDR